jgi:hypothetical protein
MTDFTNAFPANNNSCGSAFNPQMPPSYNPDTYCSPAPYYDADTKRLLAGVMNSIDPMIKANMGLCKKPALVGTVAVVGNFMAIQFLADSVLDLTVVTGSTFASYENGDFAPALLSGVTISKGTTLYLQFTQVKLISGLAICYADPFR